jgi:FkbM family methyltransferase
VNFDCQFAIPNKDSSFLAGSRLRASEMKLPFARFRRIGRYRIINAAARWGIDLFDDLEKLADTASFQMVFDVGANVGEMAELFVNHFPRATVHAFEPVDSTFTKLLRALGKHPRVVLHRLAASDTAGVATIRLFDDPMKNTLVKDLADSLRTSPSGLENIEMSRLDSVINEFKVSSIDLLKIDVEGFEASVLRGCGESLNPKKIKYVYLEFHRVNKIARSASVKVSGHSKLAELDQLLEANGYRLLVIYTQGVHQGEPIVTCNALYGGV